MDSTFAQECAVNRWCFQTTATRAPTNCKSRQAPEKMTKRLHLLRSGAGGCALIQNDRNNDCCSAHNTCTILPIPVAFHWRHHKKACNYSMSETWKNPLKGWYNKPDTKVVVKGSKIIMKAPVGSDCWLKTRQGLWQQRSINNAPFHWEKIEGNFQAVVQVSGGLGHDADKAGLMVRLDDEHWIFTGMEYHNESIHHATSVALDTSDWCIAPLPENAEKVGVWFCFKRTGEIYECFYSLDGVKWVQTRQGQFTDQPLLYVGIACACPAGNEFRVTFESYKSAPLST